MHNPKKRMNLTNNMGMFVSVKLECGFLNVISAKIDNNSDFLNVISRACSCYNRLKSQTHNPKKTHAFN